MEELRKEIESALEQLQDYNKFIHLFSEDDGKRELAELRRTIMGIKRELDAQDFKEVLFPENEGISQGMRPPGMVSIRPCGDEYEGKTYIGFLIGDVATSCSWGVKDGNIQLSWAGHNPGIYVPALKKVIYGYESWWGVIKDEEDFKKITDQDIENTWYVKAFRDMKPPSAGN